jgi:fatty acid desaturase
MEVNHRRADLLPATTVRALSGRSDWAGAVRLAAHMTLWLGLAALTAAAIGSPWLLPAMLAQGVVQVALFAGLHECVHRTAFRRRALNDAAALLLGLLVGLPAGYFRRYHLAHHRFTQDPAHDPELPLAKPTTPLQYLVYVSGWRYWRDRAAELMRHARDRVTADFVPGPERRAVAAEARWHLGLYGGVLALSLALGRAEAFWLWLGPALLAQPLLRLYLLAEHTGAAFGDDMLSNTRTTYAAWPVRWLMWNMPFHAEHHMYPSVPFHRLDALNRLLAPHLRVTSLGYAATHRAYWRALVGGRGAGFIRPVDAPSPPPPTPAPSPASA